MIDWSKVYPLLWTYRPNRAKFADPVTWRKAVLEQSKAAAVDAVARSIPQPTEGGRGLFVYPDPLGLLWKFRGRDEKRSMWANWLATNWIAEQARAESVVPPTYNPTAPLVKAAEQVATAPGGIGLKTLAFMALALLAYKYRRQLFRVKR